ncbi:WD40 repeat domain-containing protein [Gemmata sp. JC717]|uniref:WD40 repeat domain-containing protein n=1 Tax=Gemmata algarum TaxID=2975278 RepID=UPI0021BB2C12|nr:WD40 repeat domain-containing protein [Gemmata algarum]MDY3556873.1 WD40 repeat domain-containing protein [Gemmata algarum]
MNAQLETAKTIVALKGHTAGVLALAFSPDRCLLASAAADGTARVWNVSGSKVGERSVLRKAGDLFHSLAFAPNSRTLAAGSGALNGMVWLYDVTDPTAAEAGGLRGARGAVDGLCFSADGKQVAGAGADRTVRVWEPRAGASADPRSMLVGHTHAVKAVAFAPDGTGLATAASDGSVRVWSVGRIRSTERAVLAHPSEVNAVAYSADSKALATGAQDGVIRLWDVSALKPVVRAELKGTVGPVRTVLLLADGDTLVSAGDDLRVRNWSLRTGKPVREWEVPGAPATRFAFTADGRYMAKGESGGAVEVFRVAEKRT